MTAREIDRLKLLGQRCDGRGLDTLEYASPRQYVLHLGTFLVQTTIAWQLVTGVYKHVDTAPPTRCPVQRYSRPKHKC
ncbi:hypothetical protein GCM10022238_41430 [Gordonia hankookensis]